MAESAIGGQYTGCPAREKRPQTGQSTGPRSLPLTPPLRRRGRGGLAGPAGRMGRVRTAGGGSLSGRPGLVSALRFVFLREVDPAGPAAGAEGVLEAHLVDDLGRPPG